MSLLVCCAVPGPPDWRVDWDALDGAFEWIRTMRGCPQDPVHHAEGDVWIHVRLVCEALASLPEWRGLATEADRELLFAAALLHDVAKPACTRTDEDGRVTARGHSQRGAIEARRILWESGREAGIDVVRREHVCAMVRYHQIPFYLIERDDAKKMALRISQQVRCDWLAMLAKADALGRTCEDQAGLLLKIGLFEELCREYGCVDRPWPFASGLSRFQYFRREDRDPQYAAHEEHRCEVILMSGLPAAGKDTWLREHAPDVPVISLDDIREEFAGRDPGEVMQAARERARVFLRSGTGFAWNATNLTRERRGQLVDLFTDYRARVRIVHVEAPREELFARNGRRARQVPEGAIERMIDRWEMPDVNEGPSVEWWQDGRRVGP